ncbi:MAG: 5'-nucleotidase C-terminal domain-containing protein [Deltaproteobacteria bacterium]
MKKISYNGKLLALIIVTAFIFPYACTTTYKVSSINGNYIKIDNKTAPKASSKIDSIILPYKTNLDRIMNEVIGYSDGLSSSKPESTLGNWVADALEARAEQHSGSNIAFAVQNHGGLRIREIPAGPVTLSKLYELMPFENDLTILEADGKTVKLFLDRIAKYGGWPVSKSLSFRIKGETAEEIIIDGSPLNPDLKYLLAMPDYIANGGDDCFFFVQMPKNQTGILIRDILISEVKRSKENNKNISSRIEGRIK